jgi:hypothetical protein
MEKLFFLIQYGGLYRDGVFVILKSFYFQKILCNQRQIQKQIFFMDLQRIYTKKNNQLVSKRKNSIWRRKSRLLFVKILLPQPSLYL